jgi:hypothetical protein
MYLEDLCKRPNLKIITVKANAAKTLLDLLS